MHASELIGHHVIRRSVIILSEDKKIMDPSYTDPNKPAYIKDYDFANNKIILISHDGIETILTGDYNDDKWVSTDDGKKYNDVTIPVGYTSVFRVYEYAESNRKNKSTAKPKLSEFEICIANILNQMKRDLASGIDCTNVRYGDDNVVGIQATIDQCGKGFLIARRSKNSEYSIEIKNNEFASAIDKILNNGIDRLASLEILLFANKSSFNYIGVNEIVEMAGFSVIDATMYIFGISDVYKLDYDSYNDNMHIEPADSVAFSELESNATVILDSEEGYDLFDKIGDDGYYDCKYLKIG